jgi:ribosomal protein S17E
MAVKISRLHFKSLWNSEYTLFVNQTTGIMEKYPSESLHLTKAFGRVKSVLPSMAKIKSQELSNSISNQLHELDTERDTLVAAIVAQVKAMGKLSMPAVAPHVSVLDHFFDQHGRDIASANYSAETARINDLMADYDAKPAVKDAASALNLSMLFDHLGEVNSEFARQFMQRSNLDASVEKVDVRAIRTETDKVLSGLFDAIEFCSSEYDEPDYASPANELNTLIAYYKTQLKARATRRNNGHDTSGEKPIG